MRKLLILPLLLLLAPLSRGGQTVVTATITSPNGVAYANGSGRGSIVCPGNAAPTINGYTVPRTIVITVLNGFGTFTQTFYDTSTLDQTGCGYQFSISDQTTVYSFTTPTLFSVTGASANLSAAISAYAVPLPSSGGSTNIIIIDPRTYGAKCDGVAQDDVAIQTALTAANALGGNVVSPFGLNCVIGTREVLDNFVGVKVIGGFGSSAFVGNTQSTWTFTGNCASLCLSVQNALSTNFYNIALVFSGATTAPFMSFDGSKLSGIWGVGTGGPSAASVLCPIVSASNASTITFGPGTTFANAGCAVRGPTSNSVFSDKVVFNGVQFENLTVSAIENASIGWVVQNSVAQIWQSGNTCAPFLSYVGGYNQEANFLMIGTEVQSTGGNCTNTFSAIDLPNVSGTSPAVGGGNFDSDEFILGTSAGNQTAINVEAGQKITGQNNTFYDMSKAYSLGSGVNATVGAGDTYYNVTNQLGSTPPANGIVSPAAGSTILYGGVTVATGGTLAVQSLTQGQPITVNSSDVLISQPGPIYLSAYGAKCDGVTDDTLAIQSAITAADTLGNNSNAQIVFPVTACLIEDHFTNPDGSNYALTIQNYGTSLVGPAANIYGGSASQGNLIYLHNGGGSFGTAVQIGHPKQAVITGISRSSNVVTATFAALPQAFVVATGDTGANTIVVTGTTGGSTSFNGTFTLATSSTTSATWSQTGANESGTVSSSSIINDSWDNAQEYGGIGSSSHDQIRNINVTCTGGTSTPLNNGNGNYVANSAAFFEWYGGNNEYSYLRPQNCDYGIATVQGQFDKFEQVSSKNDHIGIYLGPRSDQNELNLSYDFDDTGLWINGARDTHIIDHTFASCSSTDYPTLLNVTSPTFSIYPTGAEWRRNVDGAKFFGNWWEYNPPGGAACTNAYVGLGINDTTLSTYEIEFKNPIIQGSSGLAAFIDLNEVDHVHIDAPQGFLNNITYLYRTLSGTCAPTDLTVNGFSNLSYNLIENLCTGTVPLATRTQSNNQYQVFQSNGTTSQVTYDLGLSFADFIGAGAAMHVGIRSPSTFVSALDFWNNSVKAFSVILNTNGHFQIQDSANSSFSREDVTADGASAFNSLGSVGGETFDAASGAGTGPLCKYSGGAGTPTAGACLNANGTISFSAGVTVASLPSASANSGAMMYVTDSTTISAEGQTCVGSSSNKALAFSNGTVWKCF